MIEKIFLDENKTVVPEQLQPLDTKQLSGQTKRYFGELANHIYFNPDCFLEPYVYFKDYLYISFPRLDLSMIKCLHVKERIQKGHEIMSKYWETEKYQGYFLLMDKRIIIPSFIRLYKRIPSTHRYDVFVSIYIRAETGFEYFTEDFLLSVFKEKLHSNRWKKRMKEFHESFRDGEMVSVYRGQSDLEKPITDLSWTTEFGVAQWFANRFKQKGVVLERQVRKSEIHDFLDMRNEKEVLIFPSSIRAL